MPVPDLPPAYPSEWEFDALVPDGAVVHVRPIVPSDGPALRALHGRLSPESVYKRFFSAHPALTDAEIDHFTKLDYRDRFALVAVLDGVVLAVARYHRTTGTDEAEVAFVVEDRHHGRGIATLLLEHLAAAARERGVRWFVADTLAGNHAMLGVFRDAGFPLERRQADGVVRVRFPVEETGTAIIAMEGREHRAEVASMRRLLEPASIAVVGASREPFALGHEVVRNLLAGSFRGDVFAVNHAAEPGDGPRVYRAVTDLPVAPDVAVLAVPDEDALAAAEACGKTGVAALVVLGGASADLVAVARDYGMRVVGPNSMGIINTNPAVSMNASVAAVAPRSGPLAFMGQSGPLSFVVLQRANDLGLGFSSFVSAGDRFDVSGNDVLQYWEVDPATTAILLYLETFGNPHKFARIARRVARHKPIVAVKSGRTVARDDGNGSHTAAARSDLAADALFRQAGVIRVDTLPDMLDVAMLLSHQPIPARRRVAIVSDSRGPGTLAVDACAPAGLVAAPVDVAGGEFEPAVRAALDDSAIDAVLVVSSPSVTVRRDDVAAEIARAAAGAGKPVVAVFLGTREPAFIGTGIPCFPFPEQAVRALGHVAAYGDWRSQPAGAAVTLEGLDPHAARSALSRALDAEPGGGWLRNEVALELLAAYGIPAVPTQFVAGGDTGVETAVDAAVQAAGEIGYPVVLKAAASQLLHKTDAGAVALHLDGPDAVRAAARSLVERFGAGEGLLVQAMAGSGVETIVGIGHDPSFGPLLMFGLGGIATDLLGDRAFRILPMTAADARDLVASVRSAPLLFGYRGGEPVAVGALVDLIVRVAQLGHDLPEIEELDLNPVIVSAAGAVAVDVKIRIRPAPRGPGPLLRRLR